MQPCKLLRDFKNKQIQEKALWLILNAWYFLMCVEGRRQISFLVAMNPAISGMSLTGPHYKKKHLMKSPLGFAFLKKAAAAQSTTHINQTAFWAPAHPAGRAPQGHPCSQPPQTPWSPWDPQRSQPAYPLVRVPLRRTQGGWTEARWGDFCKKTACKPTNLMEGGNRMFFFFKQPL